MQPDRHDHAVHAIRTHTIRTDAVSWHVLEAGQGPTLLLLHGTGSSTYSWRDLLPELAQHYRVLAPDLPGHADSALHDARALSLEGMASNLALLLDQLNVTPHAYVGHSAGAAVATRIVLDRADLAAQVLSINGAFVPFGGLLGQWFSPLARSLAASDMIARMIARRAARDGSVERLLYSTGSDIDDDHVANYRELFSSLPHVRATLGMMARWDLWSLQEDLRDLQVPLILFYGDVDATVPPTQAARTARRVNDGRAVSLGRLGHLAHEEDAPAVRDAILNALSPHAVS